MLFLPSIIIIVFVKKTWLRWIAGIVWFIGLVTSEELAAHYLLATGMGGGICYIIRYIIRSVIQSRKGKDADEEIIGSVTQSRKGKNVDEEIIGLVREYRNAYELVSADMSKPRLQDTDYPRVIAEIRLQRRYPEDSTTEVAVWRGLNLAVELMKESAQFARDLREKHLFQHLVVAAVLHDLSNSEDREGELAPSLKRQVIETVHRTVPQDY